MPTLEENQAHLIRADYGLAFLVLAVVLCLIILIRLWRWSSFRQIASTVAPGVLPLAMLTVSPTLATLSLGVGLYAHKLNRLKLSLPLILLIGLLLRAPLLSQSFWYDEAFTERLTTLSLSQLIPAIQADTHPPVYYTLIWLWSHLARQMAGHSEFILRLPSLVYGLLGIGLLYRLTKAFGLSERIALIAALLMAVTPAAIYYATEARSYALLTCAVFGALICLVEDRPLGFVICTALVGWLHNLGLLYVPALALAATLFQSTRLFSWGYIGNLKSHDKFVLNRRWLGYATTAALFACFWLPLTLQQMNSISNGFWIMFDAGMPFTVFTLNSLYLPREFILPVLLPSIFLTLAGFWIARRWLKSGKGTVLLIVLGGPPLIAVIVSLLWAPVFLSRVFLPLTLLALVPLAYAIDRHFDLLRAVAAPIFLAGLIVFFGSVHLLRPDYRAMMAEGCRGADALYSTAVDTAITLAPYWSGDALTWIGGQDRGLTFGVDQLPLFNLQSGDIAQLSGKTVCTVFIYSPRTLQPERDYVKALAALYPHSLKTFDVHSELQVLVYRFDLP